MEPILRDAISSSTKRGPAETVPRRAATSGEAQVNNGAISMVAARAEDIEIGGNPKVEAVSMCLAGV